MNTPWQVNTACCTKGCPSGFSNASCDVVCATAFVPFYDDCKSVIDVVFDHHSTDTTRDGHATLFAA